MNRFVRAILLLLIALVWSQTGLTQVTVFESLEATRSNSDTPPINAEWQTLTPNTPELQEYSKDKTRLWYRVFVEREDLNDTDIWSLFFWRYNLSIKVFVNGVEIGGDVFKEQRQTMGWNNPLLVDIQPSNWVAGTNVIHIQHNPSPFGGSFSPFKLGKKPLLQQEYDERYFWRIQVSEYLLVFALAIAFITALLWLNRPRDTLYLWFLGVCLCWSVFLVHMVIYQNPIPYEYWLRMVHIALSGWIFCLFGFINRHLHLQHRKLEMFVLAVFLAAIVSHITSSREDFRLYAYVSHLANTTPLLFLFALTFVKAMRTGDKSAGAVCVALIGQVLFAFHDFWLFFSAEAEAWERNAHLAHFGVPLLLGVFMYSLIVRFNDALKQSEDLNRDLEDRVLEGKMALEQSYAEREQLALQNAANEERQKIYRELHDDVGSRLMSVVHGSKDENVNRLATQALDSLRESVYRATYDDEPLLTLLAGIREEAKLRLSGVGLSLSWFEDPDLPDTIVDSKDAFHLVRLFRELISNTITHAHAKQMNVSIEVASAEAPNGQNADSHSELALVFDISDDGVGFDVATRANSRGSGIKNIEYRLEQIQAEVNWQDHGQTEGKGSGIQFSWSPASQTNA